MTDTAQIAAALLTLLRGRGETVATAESLTGGLVCAALVDVPGASDVVRGGVVAYAADLKAQLLGVDAAYIAAHGTVDGMVARSMADGVRLRLDATWGIATTGNAGPDSSEGRPVGTVFIAVAGPGVSSVRELALAGDRIEIRRSTTAAAVSLLLATLEEQSAEPTG